LDIAEVLVLGAPHPSRGEVVVAFVVSRSGQLTPSDIIDYCRDNLAGYKVPWVVSVVSELPRTGTGKLARRDLKEAAAAMVEERLRDGSAGRAGELGSLGTR
jgi:fatty-acyl-CoA synthase